MPSKKTSSTAELVAENPRAAADEGGAEADAQIDAHEPRGFGSPIPLSWKADGDLSAPAVAMAAAILDDLERAWVANNNRLGQLTRKEPDSDGLYRGYGLDESHPDVAALAALNEALQGLLDEATKNLTRMLRSHPLHPWVKATKGVGEKQAARLLAAVRDPYTRRVPQVEEGEESQVPATRTVSALWRYCGLDPVDGKARRRKRGEKANWNHSAKMRAYLVATSCLKQLVKPCAVDEDGVAQHVEECKCSPYRVVYDKRRARTRITRQGLTKAHLHADGLRVMSKEILKDLWCAARDHHVKTQEAEAA